MWTQIESVQLISSVNQGANQITVTDPNNLIQVGNWVVISPLVMIPANPPITPIKTICEIRKIDLVQSSGTGKTLTFTNPLNYEHDILIAHVSDVYIQTSPNWDILLFGADPNQTAQINTLAINNATNDCALNGGGIVSIPKGEYLVERQSSLPVCSINVDSKDNIKLIGEGIDVSVIKRDISNGDFGPLWIFFSGNNNNIEFTDFTINGNADNIPNSGNDNSSCIQFAGTDNSFINNMSLINSMGNAIYGQSINSFLLHDSTLSNNRGNGIFIGMGNNIGIQITNNKFQENGFHDCSFQNNQAYETTNCIISNNIFEAIDSNTGCAIYFLIDDIYPAYYSNVEFANNICTNRSINADSVRNFSFTNNIFNIENGIFINNFLFNKLCENIIFSNNVICNNKDTVFNIIFSSFEELSVSPAIYFTIQGINVTGNTFQNTVCKFRNVKDVLYVSNQEEVILNATPPVPYDNGFSFILDLKPELFNPDWHDWGNVTIANNQLNGQKKTGISFYKDTTEITAIFNVISITGNIIADTENYGILIESVNQQPYWLKAMITSSNTINDLPYNIANNLSTILVCGCYMMEENPNQEVWISNGDPNPRIIAPQGSLAIDNTIEADNKYQKNTLDGSNGWTLVSELDKQLLFLETFIIGPSGANLTSQPSIPPNVNVFTNSPMTTYPWKYDGNAITPAKWVMQLIINHFEGYPIIPGTNAFIDTSSGTPSSPLSDGIIKAVFRMNDASLQSSGIGIIFRYESNNQIPIPTPQYWEFYLKNPSGLPPNTYELFLDLNGAHIHYTQVEIGRSNRFVLMVIMQGNFISVYYNDLLIVTVNDSTYNTAYKHGIAGVGDYSGFTCESFKILIP